MTTVQAPADVVHAGYAAFAAGDMPALRALLTPDSLWRISDCSDSLNGEYTGPDEILPMLGGLMQESNGTFALEVVEVLSGSERCCAVIRESATVDGRQGSWDGVHVFHVRDGLIASLDGSSADPENRRVWQG